MNAAPANKAITKVKKWSYFLACLETGPFLAILGGGDKSPNSAIQTGDLIYEQLDGNGCITLAKMVQLWATVMGPIRKG